MHHRLLVLQQHLRCRVAPVLVAIAFLLPANPVAAQEIENYLGFMPKLHPRAIEATSASIALALFGDPAAAGYEDVAPIDGIDDARGRVLLALGRRFSPFLVQNTQALPINFRVYWENHVDVPLVIDTWNIADVDTALLSRETISIPDLAANPCSDPETTLGAEDDCTLLRYLRYFCPPEPASHFMTTGVTGDQLEAFRVADFDMPGHDETSWKAEFAEFSSKFLPERFNELARLYMHPFVSLVADDPDSYELVLQYWMYYPYNDGGNNHEGDWEHINVVVAPLSSVLRT